MGHKTAELPPSSHLTGKSVPFPSRVFQSSTFVRPTDPDAPVQYSAVASLHSAEEKRNIIQIFILCLIPNFVNPRSDIDDRRLRITLVVNRLNPLPPPRFSISSSNLTPHQTFRIPSRPPVPACWHCSPGQSARASTATARPAARTCRRA